MRAYMEAQSVVEIADLISMARMDSERRNFFYISVDWPIWILRAGILWAKAWREKGLPSIVIPRGL